MKKNDTFVTMDNKGGLVREKEDGEAEIVPVPAAVKSLNEEEVLSAALSDPDSQPITPENEGKLRRVSRAKTLRRALGLTQEAFAARYRIPLGTLRDWEQGRTEPDQPARAYLQIIAADPEGVRRTFEKMGH